MKEKFIIGDIVCLNSNPNIKMTVYNVIGTIVAVKYFTQNKKLKIATFPDVTLIKC